MQRDAPDFLEKVARFLDELIGKYAATPLFLCNDVIEGPSKDKAASIRVKSAMRNGDRTIMVPNEYWSPQQMLSLIACCRATVSTRYHFCLLSVLQGIPFIALQRSDKVKDLCVDLEWPYGVPIRAVDSWGLLDLYNEIQRDEHSWSGLLKDGLREMRHRALKNRETVDSLVACA
jgi:polysaccharide pyruvyl transferase WcaK-like protein